MNRLRGTILLLVSLPLLASAQTNDYSKGHGYFYVAPGLTTDEPYATLQIGGGGEGFFNRYVGIGADVGYLGIFGGDFTDNLGTFSPNLVVRFRAKDGETKVEPFVTGGYTALFGDPSPNRVNFGGGLNYWFRDRLGLRFEVRDIAKTRYEAERHILTFRIGLTFR